MDIFSLKHIRIAFVFGSIALFMSFCSPPAHIVGVRPNGSEHTEILELELGKTGIEVTQSTPTLLPASEREYSFFYADWNRDGIMDLFAVNRSGFSSTDIYILDGATGFQSFLLQQPVAYPKCDKQTDFAVTNWDNDEIPDLVVFQRNGKEPIQLSVLSGASDDQFSAFTQNLTGFSLQFSDENNRMAFHFSDYNMDGEEELAVFSPIGDSAISLQYFLKSDKFQIEKERFTLPAKSGADNYSFALGAFTVQGIKDVMLVDRTDPNNVEISFSYNIVQFAVLDKKGTIKGKNIPANSAFFGNGQKIKIHREIKPDDITFFNPEPMFLGKGPRDLRSFSGRWETSPHVLHSADGNNISGITIDFLEEEEEPSPFGTRQKMSIEFEDGYKVICIAKRGNLKFFNQNGSVNTDFEDISDFSDYAFTLKYKGKKYTFTRYIYQDLPIVINLTNEAGFVSGVSATYTYRTFGGELKNGKYDSENLDALINTNLFLSIPSNSSNIKIRVDVMGGIDLSGIDGPDFSKFFINAPSKNGCYRILGTTLNPHFDQKCQFPEDLTTVQQDVQVNKMIKYVGKLAKKDKLMSKIENAIEAKDMTTLRKLVDMDKMGSYIKKSAGDRTGYIYNPDDSRMATRSGYSEFISHSFDALPKPLDLISPPIETPYHPFNPSFPEGYLTFSTGLDVALIIGGSIEKGVMVGLDSFLNSYSYSFSSASIGLQLGVDAFIAFGGFNPTSTPLREDDMSSGIMGSVAYIGGVTVIWWWTEGFDEYVGCTIAAIVGAKGAAASVVSGFQGPMKKIISDVSGF
jgi:hypothetical protein